MGTYDQENSLYNSYPRDVTAPGPYQQRGIVSSYKSSKSPTEKRDTAPAPEKDKDKREPLKSE